MCGFTANKVCGFCTCLDDYLIVTARNDIGIFELSTGSYDLLLQNVEEAESLAADATNDLLFIANYKGIHKYSIALADRTSPHLLSNHTG